MSEKDVSSSLETIISGQIEKLTNLIGANLFKIRMPSDASHRVIESQALQRMIEWRKVIEWQGTEIAENVVEDFRSRVTALQRQATEPHILKRLPFDPVEFIGKDSTVDEKVGKRTGGNLDADKITQKDYLKSGESFINGEERLKRMKAAPDDVQLDADDFLALYEEKDQPTLRWLYESKGITSLTFWGTILRNPEGRRTVLYINRPGHDRWRWHDVEVGDGFWDADFPAAVLASSN